MTEDERKQFIRFLAVGALLRVTLDDLNKALSHTDMSASLEDATYILGGVHSWAEHLTKELSDDE